MPGSWIQQMEYKINRGGWSYEIFNPAPAPPWPQHHQLHQLPLLPIRSILFPLMPSCRPNPPSGVQTLLSLGDLARTFPHNRQIAASCRRGGYRAGGTSLWARNPRILGPAQSRRTNPRGRLLVGEDFPAGEISSSSESHSQLSGVLPRGVVRNWEYFTEVHGRLLVNSFEVILTTSLGAKSNLATRWVMTMRSCLAMLSTLALQSWIIPASQQLKSSSLGPASRWPVKWRAAPSTSGRSPSATSTRTLGGKRGEASFRSTSTLTVFVRVASMRRQIHQLGWLSWQFSNTVLQQRYRWSLCNTWQAGRILLQARLHIHILLPTKSAKSPSPRSYSSQARVNEDQRYLLTSLRCAGQCGGRPVCPIITEDDNEDVENKVV